MFGFLSMMDNYEDRKVDRFEQGDLIIDTAAVTDSAKPYETAVCHPKYNDNGWIIVETYDTKEQAQAGHDRWVAIMTADPMPYSLKDVSSAGTAELIDAISDSDWRTYKRND